LNEGEVAPDAPTNKKVSEDKKSIEKKNYKAQLDLQAPIKSLWTKIFDNNLEEGEDRANKIAWSVVKKLYTKKDDTWALKKSLKTASGKVIQLTEAMIDTPDVDTELKQMQIELAKKFLGRK